MVQTYHLLYSPKLDKLFGLTDVDGKIDWDYPCRQIGSWFSAQQFEITNLVHDHTTIIPNNVFVIESVDGNGVYRIADLFTSDLASDGSRYRDVIPTDVSPSTPENLAKMRVKPYRTALEEFCRGFYEHSFRDDRFIVVNSRIGPGFRAEFHRIFGTFAVRIHR